MKKNEVHLFVRYLAELDKNFFYNIHDKQYDPIKNILELWTSYDMDSIRTYIEDQISVYMGNPLNKEFKYNTEEMCEFTKALVKLLMSYFISHIRKLDLQDIDFLKLDNYITHERGLRISKEMYNFFHRL